MGTKLIVVLCDEHGIGGSGKYFCDNVANLDILNVFYQEASGGKYLPRAVLFNLEPSVIDAVRTSSLGCLIRPGINLVGKTGLKTTTKQLSTNSSASLLPASLTPVPKFSSPHLSSLHVLTQAQRARVNFYPLHSPLCHLGLY
jgi:tubulin beta